MKKQVLTWLRVKAINIDINTSHLVVRLPNKNETLLFLFQRFSFEMMFSCHLQSPDRSFNSSFFPLAIGSSCSNIHAYWIFSHLACSCVCLSSSSSWYLQTLEKVFDDCGFNVGKKLHLSTSIPPT